MNKILMLALQSVGLLTYLFVFFLGGTGNWLFDDVYLWQPNLQPVFILVCLFALPYYIRYMINTIKN